MAERDYNRAYYAIIPANVRYDNDLMPNAKLLYGEITALCNEKGYCWATNDYFAQLYSVSKVSVSKWISQLVEKGYIFSEIVYKEGTKEIFNRYLRIVCDPIKEKFNTPIKEKFKDNNTSPNNTVNTIYPYQDIMSSYNDKCKSFPRLKVLSDARKKAIKARINTGYSLEDFINVFTLAESSDFLKGKNDRNWSATFDWLIKDANMAKVLDGNYSNDRLQASNSYGNKKSVKPSYDGDYYGD